MADEPTDTSVITTAEKRNQPRMTNLTEMSPVPPGMGELNYIQTLLQGVVDQALFTTSSVTFAGITVTGLTASQMVGTTAGKALTSVAVGASLSLSAGTLNTIQAITTGSSPTFAGITIGSLTGILKAASGVVAAATIGASLNYSAPTLNTVQDIQTSAIPTFAGIYLTAAGGATGYSRNSTSVTSANTLIGKYLFSGNAGGTYREFAGIYSYSDAAAGSNDAPGRLEFYTTPDASITPGKRMTITQAGLINIHTSAALGLADTNASHYLRFVVGSDLSADRNFTITTGDAARTLTLNGNLTLNTNALTIDAEDGARSLHLHGDLTLDKGLTLSPAADGYTLTINGSATIPAGTLISQSLYDANTILAATADNTPAALTVAEKTLIGRSSGGAIDDLAKTAIHNIVFEGYTHGDIWFSDGGDALHTLGCGAEGNHMLQSGSAGTAAPVWGAVLKKGSFTRDIATASGTQSITGVGFKPTHGIFFMGLAAGSVGGTVGADDATSYHAFASYWNGSANGVYLQSYSLVLWTSSSDYYQGYISSWDSDGFTVTWTKTGSPTGTAIISYLVFR